jgi:hypothetical protein
MVVGMLVAEGCGIDAMLGHTHGPYLWPCSAIAVASPPVKAPPLIGARNANGDAIDATACSPFAEVVGARCHAGGRVVGVVVRVGVLSLGLRLAELAVRVHAHGLAMCGRRRREVVGCSLDRR